MKIKDIYQELFDISKKNGVIIRKESGNFKSGYCLVNEQKIIVLNKMASIDYMSKILALALNYFELDNQYLTPVIRDFIDNEINKIDKNLFKIDLFDESANTE
jgi:hypothetical protein